MQNLNSDYIVGLVDGEGSFTVYVRDPDSRTQVKRRVTVEPKFYIKLIEKDQVVLEKVKQFFGCGSIYFQKDNRPNHQNCYRYEVYRKDDLTNVIIPFFQKNNLKFPSKNADFKIFCEMMKLINKKEHLSDQGLRLLFALKKQMH